MDVFFAEMIGTALLILLGNGVVANVALKETKGHNSGWIVICAGWGFAVFVAVASVADISGAHLNPAVTVGLAAAGKTAWSTVPSYVLAQMTGALVGASLVFLFYRPHYHVTDDVDAKLATFCTGPAIRSLPTNFLCEVLATAVLVLAVLMHAPARIFTIDGRQAVDTPSSMGDSGAARSATHKASEVLAEGAPLTEIPASVAAAAVDTPGVRDQIMNVTAVAAAAPSTPGRTRTTLPA